MRQQVVAIHGGTSFDSQADYLDFIQARELTLEKLKQGEDWKATLASDLGDGFEVLLPKMPNATNARFAEWSTWFERCAAFIEANAILIGHSLGGIFLTKHLSEQARPRQLKATILVAAPFDTCLTQESLRDFALPSSLAAFEKRAGKIYLIYSKDDPVVPFTEAEKYHQALPQAEVLTFEDRGHFNQKNFPELVRLLSQL